MAGDPRGSGRVARSIAGECREDAWQVLLRNRKKARNTTQPPHTRGGWRAIPHALSRHSMGRGRKKEQDRGQKLLPDSVMHVRSASLRHGHARLGECMWEYKLFHFDLVDKERHLSWRFPSENSKRPQATPHQIFKTSPAFTAFRLCIDLVNLLGLDR